MARPNKREKQQRMARAALDAALSRGRFAEAADALARLDESAREGARAKVRAGMARAVAAAFGRRELKAVLDWLSRVEREPKLLGEGDEAASLRWMFLVASVQAKHWVRARALLDVLEPQLVEGSLLQGLKLLVASEGEPTEALLSVVDSGDAARLGYEPALPRIDYPVLTSRAQAVEVCCACFGCEPWPRFRELVQRFLTTAPAALREEIRRTALALSHRELVLRCGRAPKTALEVARFCAELAAAGKAEEDVAVTLGWCVRALAAALARPVKERPLVDAITSVANVTLRREELAPQVELLLRDARFEGTALDAAPSLFRSALAIAPTPGLVVAAVDVLAEGGRRTDPPVAVQHAWLSAACETALAQPAEFARVLGEVPAKRQVEVACDVLAWLPAPLGPRLVDAVFPHASESLREALAEASIDLLDRFRTKGSIRDPFGVDLDEARDVLAEFNPAMADLPAPVLRMLLSSPEAREAVGRLLQDAEEAAPLPQSAREHFERIAAHVVPYRVTLLEAALGLEKKPLRRRALISQFWARRPTLESRFKALCEAVVLCLPEAAHGLEKYLLADILPTPRDFARTLFAAEREGAPRRVRNLLARGLLESAEKSGTQADQTEVQEALRLARRLVRPKRGSAKAPRKAAATSRKAQPKKQPATRSKPRARASESFEKEAAR